MELTEEGISSAAKEKMADTESEVTDQLRDKLRSKIEVAKFFTAFITLFIGILLDGGRISSLVAKIGIISLILSLGFCVAAIFLYDHLLWPKKYWKDSDKKSEDCFHNRLSEEMISAWRWLFIPAVVFFGFGLVLVLAQELGHHNTTKVVWGFVLVVALVLPILVCRFRWPNDVGPE